MEVIAQMTKLAQKLYLKTYSKQDRSHFKVLEKTTRLNKIIIGHLDLNRSPKISHKTSI